MNKGRSEWLKCYHGWQRETFEMNQGIKMKKKTNPKIKDIKRNEDEKGKKNYFKIRKEKE